MYASNYLETKILQLFNGVTFNGVNSLYLELSSTAPTESGSNVTPPTYSGYTRKQILFSIPADMSGGIGIQNTEQVEFAQSLVDSATITHIAIYDSLNAGNFLMYGVLNTPIAITTGKAPVVRQGSCKYWFSGNFSKWLKTAILNVLRGTTLAGFTPYATLFNGSPEGGGVELVGGNFERKPIVFTSPAEQATGQMLISNSADVEFPVATVNLGNYDHDCVFDAAAAGNCLLLTQNATDNYLSGDMVKFGVSNLKVAVN